MRPPPSRISAAPPLRPAVAPAALTPTLPSPRSTNVRKAAALTSAKQEAGEHDSKASDLRASHQVKLALTDSTVVGQDPPRPKEFVKLEAVWPYGRSREGKDL